MRLDKFLCDSLGVTRKEANQLIKRKEISVDGAMRNVASIQVNDTSKVEWKERQLTISGPRYIMLFKPDGYVCSHEDSTNPTAFVLLDEIKMDKLHFAGRLDVDTTGLVLITDDGKWSHRITSPKHNCSKRYRVWLAEPIQDDYIEKFEQGVQLNNEKGLTLPAKLEIIDREENEVLLTIQEGKYHQVKRMFAALGNKVEGLHRDTIGSIQLDETLEPGQYRYLTAEEAATF